MMKLCIALLSLWLNVASPAQSTAVPFQLIDGWAVLLEGTLGGLSHQKFLIDTGAVPSSINLRVARQLGLSGSVEEVSVMNRAVLAQRVRVPSVSLGVITTGAMDMVAMDLAPIERELGTRIDAVIGLDVLGERNFSLDYLHKNLDFSRSAAVAGTVVFETNHEAGGTYIVIPLESGGEKLRLLVDTGTRDLMLFECRLGGSLRHLHILGQDSTLNSGGRDRLSKVELHSVKIGSFLRQKQRAYVWTTTGDQLRSFDGLLGPTALGTTIVGFDFDRHVISFQIR